ncbi:MAG: CAP domain-containing protein [Pyrinomonadaceae bacterium]
MLKKIFVFLGVFAVLASISFAQNNSPQNVSGPNVNVRLTDLESGLARYLESDDEVPDVSGRPRIVEAKAFELNASVIVNIGHVERTVFELVNQKRAENGLSILTWNDQLETIARAHSQNMAEFSFFSHRGLDNKMVSDRADASGVKKWSAIGENIAYNRGYQDPLAKAVDLWLNSPSHRHNMLDDGWKDSAIGVAVAADGSYYFTQVFIKK